MSTCENQCKILLHQHKVLPYHTSLHFAQVKTFQFQVKEMESHPLSFSVSIDVLTASNPMLHVAILMRYGRPGRIPGISQKIFSQPEPKQNLLKQIWQSVIYVPRQYMDRFQMTLKIGNPRPAHSLRHFNMGKALSLIASGISF